MLENRLAPSISLNGDWYISMETRAGRVRVPGAWDRQGYSANENNALYYRLVDVPEDWAGARVYLRCGAVSYACEAWVNAIRVGQHEGLWTAFEFDVTDAIRPGLPNEVELRITKPANQLDQPYSYRDTLVGFIPYISTTFGGPWQDVDLVAHRQPAFYSLHLDANPETGVVHLHTRLAHLENVTLDELIVTAEIVDGADNIVARESLPGNFEVSFALAVENPVLWSPSRPNLYTARLRLQRRRGSIAETSRRFGFRALRAEGDQLLLNGQPAHLRGVLSWGWKPDTLAPMPTESEVREEFQRVRELGFNLYKLCLYVPPEVVFRVADEMGMLLWLEMPMWWQRLSDHLRQQAAVEYADVFAAVHHHPSVVIYSLGCELSADMADADLLGHLDTLAREVTSGALICDNSGSGEAYRGLAFDYADFTDYHFYCDLHYFTPLCDHFRRDWRPARPWIFGEFCDSDDYRDLTTLAENGWRPWWRDLYGVEGSPDRWAYAEQEKRMAVHQLPFTDQRLAELSRRQSLLVRKTIIERLRARAEMGGYVVTGLRDTPISTSGVFDDRDRAKHSIEQWRVFNDDMVLILEQGRARAWKNGGDRPAPFDRFNHWGGSLVSFRIVLAHAGAEQPGGRLFWHLVAPSGSVVEEGVVEVPGPLLPGAPRQIAALEWTLPDVRQAGEYHLQVNLSGEAVNEWPLWIYPALPPWPEQVAVYDPVGLLPDLAGLRQSDFTAVPGHVLIASAFTPAVEFYLRDGGKVVLLQPGGGALSTRPVPFWRESIKLLYDHPVLRAFPHRGHVDLQFYHLATDQAFDSAAFPTPVTPVIRRLDARAFTLLDYLVETQIGRGRMLASTLRFQGGAGDQVDGLNANIAGLFLLYQMVDYLRSVD